jgi:hypothetical protein
LPQKKPNCPPSLKSANPPDLFAPFKPAFPFFEFRHSYRSVAHIDGKTHLKAAENRFANGKFESEEFEATAGGEFYRDAVKLMWDIYADMFSRLTNPSSFLDPFMRSPQEWPTVKTTENKPKEQPKDNP